MTHKKRKKLKDMNKYLDKLNKELEEEKAKRNIQLNTTGGEQND